jgi:hypothetical protein
MGPSVPQPEKLVPRTAGGKYENQFWPEFRYGPRYKSKIIIKI